MASILTNSQGKVHISIRKARLDFFQVRQKLLCPFLFFLSRLFSLIVDFDCRGVIVGRIHRNFYQVGHMAASTGSCHFDQLPIGGKPLPLARSQPHNMAVSELAWLK